MTRDPVYAAIAAHRAEIIATRKAWAAVPDHPGPPPWSDEVDAAQDHAEKLAEHEYEVLLKLFGTRPTTIAGFKAQAEYIIEEADTCGSTREALPQLRAIFASALALLGDVPMRIAA